MKIKDITLKAIKVKLLKEWYQLCKKPTLKQEILLRLALKEKGIKSTRLKIQCDHDLGTSVINGVEVGIKYPDSFFSKAFKLIPPKKTINFYFNGNMQASGKRQEMLGPFKKLKGTMIVSSNEGRIIRKKGRFNTTYFRELAMAKYGLCPHQADWPGSKKHMWTYRFIESCFVGAIPVLFKEAPLGNSFIEDFNYVWDADVLENPKLTEHEISGKIIENNRTLARNKFCLTKDECIKIKNTLK